MRLRANHFRLSWRFRRCWALIGLLIAPGMSAMAAGEVGRLPYNGDFEVGTAGYETVRILRPDTNPKLDYLPLVADTQAKHTGKTSLRVDNPHAEQTELHSSEFILKANRTYTVSGYIRSDLPGGLPVLAALEHYSFKHQNLNVRKELSVGSAWQPFSFELKTKDFDGFFHLIFTLKSGKAGTIWLDDLRVVEKETVANPQPEAGIYVDRKLFVGSGQTAVITVKLHNPTRQAINRPLRLVAVDDYFNTSVPIAAIPVSVAPGETRDFTVRWLIPRFGAYRLELAGDAAGIHSFPAYLACIERVEPVKYRNDRFMPGFNSGLSMVGPNRVTNTGWEISGQNPDEFVRVLSAVGCRLIRGHDNGSTYWYDIEPEPGKFDLSWLEQSLGLYEKNNIAYMPVLVAVCSERQGGWEKRGMRDWQKQLCRVGKDWRNQGKYYHPPIKNWRAYVQVLAERFKDRVPAWEIINEPQFKMSSADYMEYLASASDVLRRIKPDAYLVGICSTSDFGADIGKFATDVMTQGGLKYLDAVSFHPYASRELTSASPADLQITAFKKNVNRFEKKPIWEGELYYLFDGPTMQEWYRSGRFEAHQLVQRYIVDCGEGCAQSHPVSTGQLWRRMLVPNYEGGKCNEAYPSSGMVAFATLSELLTSATPIYKNKRNGVVIYGFRHRNGKLFAAVWKYGSNEGLKIDLKDFDGKDMFGNPLEKKVYLMSSAPFYLLQGQYSETEFLNRLNHLTISYDNPVTMIPVVRLTEKNSKLKALVTLVNHGDREYSGVIGLKGACKNQTPFSFKIGPQKTASFMIDVVRGEGTTATVSLYVNGSLKTLTAPTVDIQLAEAGKPFKLFDAGKKPFGSGRFSVSAGKLTLELDIPDRTLASPRPDREAWQQDGIEFFVDPEPYALNTHAAGSYSPDIFRFFVLPRLPEPKQFKVWKNNQEMDGKDFSCRVVPGETGYKVILSMELKKLHLKDNALGIEIKISDADAALPPARTAFFSGGNPEPFRNRTGFGIFKF